MNRRSFFQSLAAAAAAVVGSKLAPAAVEPAILPGFQIDPYLTDPDSWYLFPPMKTYTAAQYGLSVRVSRELLESDTHARLWRSIAEMGARLREEQDAAMFDLIWGPNPLRDRLLTSGPADARRR